MDRENERGKIKKSERVIGCVRYTDTKRNTEIQKERKSGRQNRDKEVSVMLVFGFFLLSG